MDHYMVTVLISTMFYLTAYRMTRGNIALNLLASWGLLVVITWLLPELRFLPTTAYIGVWLLAFVGLQFILPIAEGKSFVWRFETQRFVMVNAFAWR